MFVYIRSAAFVIVVTQKLVLQQSKNVTAKCTETLSLPPWVKSLNKAKCIKLCAAVFIKEIYITNPFSLFPHELKILKTYLINFELIYKIDCIFYK